VKSKERNVFKGFLEKIEKFKYVLLIALIGGLLLLWPQEQPKEAIATRITGQDVDGFDLEQMEQRMSAALSKMEGTGEVTVLLTVQTSPRRILAVDQQKSDEEHRTETVVISKGSGNQEAVLLEQVYPEYQGALVICSGAEDPAIRLKLVEAVSALTGLGADKISICKGK